MRIARRPLAAVLLALVVPLGCASGGSGNGIEDRSAAAIFDEAKNATADADSFRLSGKIDAGDGNIVLDLALSAGRGSGTVTLDGAELEVRRDKSTVYLRGAARAWEKLTGEKAAGQLLAGRWIKAPASNKDFSDLASFLDADALRSQLTPEGRLRKGPKTTFRGAKAITLLDGTGSKLYVATEGDPFILGFTNTGRSGGAGSITFADYDVAKVAGPPRKAIDITELTSG